MEGGRRREAPSGVYILEDPLTLFIRVVSLKAKGKGKPLGRVAGRKAVSCGGMEEDGEETAAQGPC